MSNESPVLAGTCVCGNLDKLWAYHLISVGTKYGCFLKIFFSSTLDFADLNFVLNENYLRIIVYDCHVSCHWQVLWGNFYD